MATKTRLIYGWLGDSIAVGLHAAAGFGFICAKVGRPASLIAKMPLSDKRLYDVVVISAGSNNPRDPNLRKQLLEIKAKTRARQVIWVLPHDEHACKVVSSFAQTEGDDMVSFVAGPDHVHPHNYHTLLAAVRRAAGEA